MNGPSHYREAEKLLRRAEDTTDKPDVWRQFLAQCAQVHATLALAAATAEVEPVDGWHEVTK